MILVYAEHHNGKLKKASFEAVTFGARLAEKAGTDCGALVVGDVQDAGDLGKSGATRVYHVKSDIGFDNQAFAAIITQAAEHLGAQTVVVGHSASGKALLGRVAVRWNASSATSITAAEPDGEELIVTRPSFSGKAISHYRLKGGRHVVSLMTNSLQPTFDGSEAPVEELTVDIPEPKVKVRESNTVEGTVPLPEAELVVSAGRGMKDPSNWGIIEELADALGASTACSRPVSDAGWRPHREHVGQTGIAIRPNLYIAVGISGAIQHLAGVNNSKVIVVVNKDPEAPFFKAADYGVEGDLFDVVPRLTDAVRKFKQEQASA